MGHRAPAALLAIAILGSLDCAPRTSVVEAGGFRLAVARTLRQRERGLMGVRVLPPEEGMVFVMPPGAQPVFWMKDCEVSLDMVFVGGRGQVLRILHADPQKDGQEIRLYSPAGELTESGLMGREIPYAPLVVEVAGGQGERFAKEPLSSLWKQWVSNRLESAQRQRLRGVL
jgi:uncharacterized membrane protein (UPF0127 family)